MTLADAVAYFKNIPGDIDQEIAKLESAAVAAEQEVTPIVDEAKAVFPQAYAIYQKYLGEAEKEVNALVADLPPSVAEYINKYLQPLETNIP